VSVGARKISNNVKGKYEQLFLVLFSKISKKGREEDQNQSDFLL